MRDEALVDTTSGFDRSGAGTAPEVAEADQAKAIPVVGETCSGAERVSVEG